MKIVAYILHKYLFVYYSIYRIKTRKKKDFDFYRKNKKKITNFYLLISNYGCRNYNIICIMKLKK